MNERAIAAANEILARIDKLQGLVPSDSRNFRLPPRSDARDIVERNLEIISEASRRLQDDLKALHPDVNWRVVADLGNVLRHAYHRVEEVILIETVVDHLTPLRSAVVAVLANLDTE